MTFVSCTAAANFPEIMLLTTLAQRLYTSYHYTTTTTYVCVLRTDGGPTGNTFERTENCNEQIHSSLSKLVLRLSIEHW